MKNEKELVKKLNKEEVLNLIKNFNIDFFETTDCYIFLKNNRPIRINKEGIMCDYGFNYSKDGDYTIHNWMDIVDEIKIDYELFQIEITNEGGFFKSKKCKIIPNLPKDDIIWIFNQINNRVILEIEKKKNDRKIKLESLGFSEEKLKTLKELLNVNNN